MIASGFAALIFVICDRNCRSLCWKNSCATTSPPAFCSAAGYDATIERPQSSLSVRKAKRLPCTSAGSSPPNALPSIGVVATARKKYGFPCSVSCAAVEMPVMCGILYFFDTSIIAAVDVLQNAPSSATTLSRTTSFSAALTDCAGLQAPSSTISSILRPSTPPFAFMSSTSILTVFT